MLQRTVLEYRNAYSGLSRNTWLLSFIMLINRSGTMVVPFMTLYLVGRFNYSYSQAGIVYGMFGAGALFGAFVGGKLTDKIGFYPIQLVTLVGGGGLFLLLGQVTSYVPICIVTFLTSFVNEAFRPANSTAITFFSKEENRTRSFALNRLAINLGWAIGSFIGGIVASYNYELLFWVDGVTNIAAGVMMWFFLKPVDYQVKKTSATVDESKGSVYKDKLYWFFILLVFLFACCFFQLFSNLSLYYHEQLDFSKQLIGVMMALNGLLIVAFEMLIVYRLENIYSSLFYVVMGSIMVCVAYCLLSMPHYGIALAFLMVTIITVGEMFAMPFMNSFWISRTQSHNRGQYAAVYTMAWGAAQSLGPMLGAQVAQHAGFSLLWWGISILMSITALGFWRLKIYQELSEK